MGNCLARPKTPTVQHEPPKVQEEAQPDLACAFPPVDKQSQLQRSLLGKRHAEDVTEHYEIGRVLGAGYYGTTRIAVHKGTGEVFACKSINKSRLGDGDAANVRSELQIMHHLAGNPNIVTLHEAFEDHVYVHLIMELCSGGDLVERIMSKGSYTERDAAAAVRKMLEVVAYCHELGVVHRDLKPDNFLLSDPTERADLKATDFGLSTFIKPGQQLSEVCGTAYYMAPEVLLRSYTEKADVWALGVVLYILLCGRPPFEHALDEEIFRMVVDNGVPDFTYHAWDNITEPAKECVRLMMTYSDKRRPSARDMLGHEWIREGGVAGSNVIEPEVLHRMRSFAAMNKLKKKALLFISQHLAPDEIRGLRELFASMDADGSGTITLDELRTGLASRGAALPEGELAALMAMADVDGSRELDYTEFVAATMHACKVQHEQLLIEAFQHFDTDDSGFITREELEVALREHAADAGQLQGDIDAVLAQADKDGNGLIDYAEFVQMMLPGDRASQCNAAKFAANWARTHSQKRSSSSSMQQLNDTATSGGDQQQQECCKCAAGT
ncbi:hypothetical protein OEZ86_000550 [Tetradesmus obliquus]|nr:hypothetical protein OEZ86_000550 [Tetradesmus obliquus]